jgi:hypothetical protein
MAMSQQQRQERLRRKQQPEPGFQALLQQWRSEPNWEFNQQQQQHLVQQQQQQQQQHQVLIWPTQEGDGWSWENSLPDILDCPPRPYSVQERRQLGALTQQQSDLDFLASLGTPSPEPEPRR